MAPTARLTPGDRAPALRVQPVFGLPLASTGRRTAVLFLRSLAGATARVAVERIQEAWPRYDAAGHDLVAFTRCELAFARDFVPRHHVLFPLVVDAEGRWFEAFGVGRDRGLVRTALGLRPRHLALLTQPRAGFGGDHLPAEFALDADGTVLHARYGRTALDLPDLEALWAAVSR